MAFVVAAAFATASSAAAQTQWTEYRIAGGDYRIEFPAAPKEVVRKLPSGIPTYTASLAPDTNTYFSVTANAIVSSMLSKPTEILLDLARNGQVRGTKGTLREEERLTVGGAPARRLVIDSSPYVLYVLLVVKGDQLYQALYVAASGHDNQADMLHFLVPSVLSRSRFSTANLGERINFRQPQARARLSEGFRKAGLPA
jgi:hypothetical protein